MKKFNLLLSLLLVGSVASASFSVPNKSITQAKLASRSTGTTVGAGGVAISGSSGSYSTTSGSYSDVTNLSVTITSTGRPISVFLVGDGTAAASTINAESGTTGVLRILRGATEIYETSTGIAGSFPSSSVRTLDAIAAGTYTYKVQMLRGIGTNTAYCANAKLVAHEI